ncbi:hypothetical protein E2C01_022179 [Portunus trituberculatus]|uniref:Uncharacterized protein n=1 Tax=Portunus trituberculatus TaxID=210409 RepID=A0A5B7E6Z2_PORTR|nr:hypothetical protein [Portunus trituberculatus]
MLRAVIPETPSQTTEPGSSGLLPATSKPRLGDPQHSGMVDHSMPRDCGSVKQLRVPSCEYPTAMQVHEKGGVDN